jgi:hypothetical protein
MPCASPAGHHWRRIAGFFELGSALGRSVTTGTPGTFSQMRHGASNRRYAHVRGRGMLDRGPHPAGDPPIGGGSPSERAALDQWYRARLHSTRETGDLSVQTTKWRFAGVASLASPASTLDSYTLAVPVHNAQVSGGL